VDIAASRRRGATAPPISPIALDVVNRIDAIFAIEREINGLLPEARLVARCERSQPLVTALEDCGPSGRGCPVRRRSPRQWTTC
jgi:hypothetical protein